MLNDFILLMLALPAAGAVYLASVVMGKLMVVVIRWLGDNL